MNTIDYLRISLVDRCNFRCTYCMPEESELQYLLSPEILTNAEIITLIKEIFIPLGFRKFRLTGGEPLLRPNLVDLIAEMVSLQGVEDIALTTNAFLLETMAEDLYQAGLRRINISLDSLNAQTFNQIIGNRGQDKWLKTWQGILKAHEVGFNPLKLNIVVIPNINDGEILELAQLTINRNWHIRFIEFMPIGNSQLFGEKQWIPSEEIRQQIREKWGLESAFIQGNGPADVFKIPHAQGTIGFISQMSECFCDRCNRLRLSADGWLRPCLLNETGQIDLKTALRQGNSLPQLRKNVKELIEIKPEINFKLRNSGTPTGVYSRTMSQIGG